MPLSAEDRAVIVGLELEKAYQTFREAELNAPLNLWSVVSNRLYYATYHAVIALLVSEGLQVGTHKGAQNQFGQHFVMTGKFSMDDAKLYARLLNMREKADYNCSYKTDAEEMQPYIPQVKNFIDSIKSYINTI